MQNEQTMKRYKDQRAFQKDAPNMLARGWYIQSQNSYQPRAGIGRIVALGGIGALVFKPKEQVMVTYVRSAVNVPPPLQGDPNRPGYSADGRRLTLKENIELAKQRRAQK
jgi:hypothetical protein